MKTTRKLGLVATVALSGMFMLNGCGGGYPVDVSKEFVNAVSEADFEEARELFGERVQKLLSVVEVKCARDKYREAKADFREVMKKMRSLKSDKEYSEKAQKMMKEQADAAKELTQKMRTYQEENYGKRPSREEKLMVAEHFSEDIRDTQAPLISGTIDMIDIKLKTDKDLVVEVFTNLAPNGYLISSKLDQALIKKIGEKYDTLTPACIDKRTVYGYIEDINHLETNSEAADKAEVRLELINKDDKSEKVSLSVEKIKGEWKVVEL